MVITQRRVTIEDWLARTDDGRRCELLNGELVEIPPPTADHARLVAMLDRWLGRAEQAGYGREPGTWCGTARRPPLKGRAEGT